jgi:hypothetical protein
MFTAAGGQTVGKMLMGLRVVGDTVDSIDDHLTMAQAALRAVLAPLSVLGTWSRLVAGRSLAAASHCTIVWLTRASSAHEASRRLDRHHRTRRIRTDRARHRGISGRCTDLPGTSSLVTSVSGAAVIVRRGRRRMGGLGGAAHFSRSDPSQVVIDEVAGQLLTYLGLGLNWPGDPGGFPAVSRAGYREALACPETRASSRWRWHHGG